jgi:hypothetical protein
VVLGREFWGPLKQLTCVGTSRAWGYIFFNGNKADHFPLICVYNFWDTILCENKIRPKDVPWPAKQDQHFSKLR